MRKGKGWQLKTEKPPIGSYDAIRVYLWVGMLHDGDKQKARLLQRFAPMAAQTTEQGYPGESEYRHRQNQRPGASGLLRGNAAVLQDDEAGRCNASASPITIPARMPTTAQF